jgi:hypothetical protein
MLFANPRGSKLEHLDTSITYLLSFFLIVVIILGKSISKCRVRSVNWVHFDGVMEETWESSTAFLTQWTNIIPHHPQTWLLSKAPDATFILSHTDLRQKQTWSREVTGIALLTFPQEPTSQLPDKTREMFTRWPTVQHRTETGGKMKSAFVSIGPAGFCGRQSAEMCVLSIGWIILK